MKTRVGTGSDSVWLRAQFGVLLAGVLVWQAFAVALSFRNAPVLQQLFSGLGTELPLVTRTYFASYKLWVLVPLSTLVLALDVLRRDRIPRAYSIAVLAVEVLLALGLHAWLQEAWFRPMFDLIKAIG